MGLLARIKQFLIDGVVGPSRSVRRRHIPILGTYFGYGALGLTAVAELHWLKRDAEFTPAELAVLSIWLALPWSIKMVFGLLVDSLPIARSTRRSWLLVGSAMIAAGLLLNAANASGLSPLGGRSLQFAIASFLISGGIVLQDVVADALTSEIVPRVDADGNPRPQQAIVQEMAMVQVMGRFVVGLGAAITGLLAVWVAEHLSAASVYLLGLAIPCVTAATAVFGELPDVERHPFDWMMLAGGAVTGGIVLATTTGQMPAGQEIVFLVSLAVAVFLLWRVALELDPAARRVALTLAALIFALRSAPSIGDGYRWYGIDVLAFDEPFFGRLAQLQSTAGLLGLWVMCRVISSNNQIRVLLVLILIEPLLALPSIGPIFGLHRWTEAALGIGARELAVFDTWLDIRFSNLGMIAMLTLTAFYAPPGRTATWFTLMASIMNLALVAGQLQTKYLNMLFPLDRGSYDRLPELAIATLAVGTIVPWLAAMILGRRLA